MTYATLSHASADLASISSKSNTAAVVDADVIIIGGGGAGLSAAVEASSSGARVMLLEKAPELGGSTRWSVGSFTAAETSVQKKAGVVDQTSAHSDDLKIMNDRVRPEGESAHRCFLAREAPGTFEWLRSLGIEFVGPFPEPPHRAARMHNVVPGSRAYIDRLSLQARKQGVRMLCNVQVDSLLVEESRVRGVTTLDGSQFRSSTVVIATGDFSASADLLAQFISVSVSKFSAVNLFNTGDGHRMGAAVGADLCRTGSAQGSIRFVPRPMRFGPSHLPTWPWFARALRIAFETMPAAVVRPFLVWFLTSVLQPHPSLYGAGAVLVNRNGERFCDEEKEPAFALSQQPEGIAHIVFDDRVAKMFSQWPNFLSTAPGVGYAYVSDLHRYRSDLCMSARTLVGLAGKIGVDPARLESSLANSSVARPPFYALGPVKPVIVLTDGGLFVDEQMRVIDRNSRPILGLFAAGAAGQGNLLLEGHGHHLAWAFCSGRYAGRNAARLALDLRTT